MKIALAQIDVAFGDVAKNVATVKERTTLAAMHRGTVDAPLARLRAVVAARTARRGGPGGHRANDCESPEVQRGVARERYRGASPAWNRAPKRAEPRALRVLAAAGAAAILPR